MGAFRADLYEDIDLDRLTAYGMKVLLDQGRATTFENMVVTLYTLFPSKFSLLGYPQFPDAARVNRALLHCLPKYKNYATGKARTGYQLTHQGLGAAEETAVLLQREHVESVQQKRKRPSLPRGVADQFMREVEDSKPFRLYIQGQTEEVKKYDVTRLLHSTPETPADILRRNMVALKRYATESNRSDILEFLEWATKNFDLPA
jgi:hypothetical protein